MQIGGVRWGSNNYHQDHPLFEEYLNGKLGTNVGGPEREFLVKKWEDVMIHHLNPLRQHAKNSSFADGEKFGDLQLEFNMWVSFHKVIVFSLLKTSPELDISLSNTILHELL